MRFSAGVKSRAFKGQEKGTGGMVTRDLLARLAEAAKASILDKTSRGVDYRRRPFHPYSRSWKKRREERGLGTSRVNLRFTGKMLQGLSTEADPVNGECRVLFKDPDEAKKAYCHDVSGAGTSRIRRQFLGLDKKDATKLAEAVEQEALKAVEEAFGL